MKYKNIFVQSNNKIKFIKEIFVHLLILLFISFTWAKNTPDFKVAVIELESVWKNLHVTLDLEKKIKELRNEMLEDKVKEQDILFKKMKKLKDKKNSMRRKEYSTKYTNIEKCIDETQKEINIISKKIKTIKSNCENFIYKNLKEEIKNYCQNNKIHIVFRSSNEYNFSVIYNCNSIDISNHIVEVVNKKIDCITLSNFYHK